MHCIYNLYIKEMKFNNNIQAGMLCLLIMGAGMATTTNKKAAVINLMTDTANGLIQVKNTNAGTVRVQLMPETGYDADDKKNTGYNVRITLKSNQLAKQAALMQYMNFDIRNCFYAVQGRDRLTCVVCERIPGISRNEFLYMTRFNKPLANAADNLRICIADTVAGFGITAFEIKKQALTKLEAIK
jgi:hypothetical protein